MKKTRILVWGENVHEQRSATVRKIYPNGMHRCIANGLATDETLSVETATLEEPDHGLADSRLNETDVLVWWGHIAHNEVRDHIAARLHKHVLEGMGLVVLHSGHDSKIFKRLMGTTCSLVWREAGERERLWVCLPGHPIAQGIGSYVEIPNEEMYGEPFAIPTPDELVFISWFQGGEVFRGGCCWRRGNGKIFYFRPGHESYPTYHRAEIKTIIRNAVKWAAPTGPRQPDHSLNATVSLERLRDEGYDS